MFNDLAKQNHFKKIVFVGKPLGLDIELSVSILDDFTGGMNGDFLFAFAFGLAKEICQMQVSLPELTQQRRREVRIRAEFENSLSRFFRHEAERVHETSEVGVNVSL